MKPAKTRLQEWLTEYQFTSAELEQAASIGRTQMTKIRNGGNPTLRTMRRILSGARIIARRRVHILELFDLDSDYESPVLAGAPARTHGDIEKRRTAV